MGLVSVGGRLLAVAGRFASECCCRVKRYSCVVIGADSCGNPLEQCQESGPEGEYLDPNCNGLCKQGGPCECTPPCDGCSTCEEGDCVPNYGPCEQCVDGEIVPLCGECETCVDGVCYPCPPGYECVDGVCVGLPPPSSYYCCYEYAETDSPGSPGESPPVVTGTYCSSGPCGSVVDGVFVPDPSRTAGGPYGTAGACGDSCRPHACEPDACNDYFCVPDENSAYLTKEECNENCDDPTAGQCALSPDNFTASGTGAGVWSYFFTVGAAEFANGREICVAYVSTKRRPIRVQIWSPDMSFDGCTQIADRTIKGDSQWRCDEDCPCDEGDRGDCVGLPKGFVKWRTKQKNVTTFEVQVRTECADNEWQIAVTCGPCAELPDMDGCCVLDEDCPMICGPGDVPAEFADGTKTCCLMSEAAASSGGCTATYLGIGFLNGVETCRVQWSNCPPESDYLEGLIGFLTDAPSYQCCCEGECVPCNPRWCRDENGDCVPEDQETLNCPEGTPYCSQSQCENDNPLP
jgi:hypothetical protein